jgi:hypothetical protein
MIDASHHGRPEARSAELPALPETPRYAENP